MSTQLLIEIFLQSKILIVSFLIIVLLPIVFYIASLDRRPVKIERVPSKKMQKKAGMNKAKEEKEQDEKDNNKRGEGT